MVTLTGRVSFRHKWGENGDIPQRTGGAKEDYFSLPAF